MPDLAFVVAGAVDARTGGSIYNRQMIDGLRRFGWTVDVYELHDTFPFPSADALGHAASLMREIADARSVIVDGLAYGAMPDVIITNAGRLRMIALVHLPLAAEIGLPLSAAERLQASERVSLAHADRVIVTGHATLPLMREYGLSHHDIVVVEPGIDPAALALGSQSEIVHLLTVGAVTPGKGHLVLIEALASLPQRQWCLTCAGSLTRDITTVAQLHAAIRQHGLAEHVMLTGELDSQALADCYQHADVLVAPSLRETYGMVVSEALARGLPVIASRTGAIPALLADDAGIVVPPGDTTALSAVLGLVIEDHSTRARLAAGARRTRERLRSWDQAARELGEALSA